MNQSIFQADFLDRLKSVEDILIRHKHFDQAVARIEDVLHLAKSGAEPRHTLICGESGTGKTWLSKFIKNLYPDSEIDGRRQIPILVVETPSRPSLSTLSEAILHALGDPFAHRGSTSVKRMRALSLIRSCGVQLIFFDELQHFVDHGIFDSLHAVSDWLKLFIEDVGKPIVLMGLPRCEAILQLNEQLRRRFSSRLLLRTFSIESESDEIELRAVLHEIDKRLLTDRLSGFANVELLPRFYFASNGHIGHLRTLITRSFEIMVNQNRQCIDIAMLEQAFVEVIWNLGEGALNPFNSNFKFRNLDRVGEPFSVAIAPTKGRLRSGK